jgi:hypothetical protein
MSFGTTLSGHCFASQKYALKLYVIKGRAIFFLILGDNMNHAINTLRLHHRSLHVHIIHVMT